MYLTLRAATPVLMALLDCQPRNAAKHRCRESWHCARVSRRETGSTHEKGVGHARWSDQSPTVMGQGSLTTTLTASVLLMGSLAASVARAQTSPDVQLTLNGAPVAVGTYAFPFPAGSTGLVLDNGLVRFTFNGKSSTSQTMLARSI